MLRSGCRSPRLLTHEVRRSGKSRISAAYSASDAIGLDQGCRETRTGAKVAVVNARPPPVGLHRRKPAAGRCARSPQNLQELIAPDGVWER
jgi:hypothetical protein